MSKKEIRRAARDSFPKAKGGSGAKKSSGGAYSRTRQPAGARSSGGRPAVKPPSMKRSLIFGLLAAVFYFVLIQWILRLNDSVNGNLVISAVALVLFTSVNYLTDSFRYRRFLRKNKGPDG